MSDRQPYKTDLSWGEVVPLAAGTGLVEQGVDDLPHLIGALVAADGVMLNLPAPGRRGEVLLLQVAR